MTKNNNFYVIYKGRQYKVTGLLGKFFILKIGISPFPTPARKSELY